MTRPLSFHAAVLCLFAVSITNVTVAEESAPKPELDERAVVDVLGEAVSYFDEIPSLPESKLLGRDQEEATDDMNALMDEALEVLDLPGVQKMRSRYRDLEENLESAQSDLSELKEKRVFAQEGEASTLAKYTPTETLKNLTASTRADYDELIATKEEEIQRYQDELRKHREVMSESLASIGVDMTPDQLELWLSSAIGDDVMSMSVVFQSIREVTLRLEELTAESGENLDFAKRYYGMVVILHKLIVRMQETFVARVDEEVLPKLASYREEADDIIAQSRRLIREGGNRASLEGNIESNELTKKAIALYEKVVQSQRDKVAKALDISEREEEVAINTYRTVQLSSNVTSLIKEGAETFKTLSNLQVPETAKFENEEVRTEFRKLTERMAQGD